MFTQPCPTFLVLCLGAIRARQLLDNFCDHVFSTDITININVLSVLLKNIIYVLESVVP